MTHARTLVRRPRRMQQLLMTGATYKAQRLEATLKRVLPRLLATEEAAVALGCALETSEETLSMLERRSIQETLWSMGETQRSQSANPSTKASESSPVPLLTPPQHLVVVACLTSRSPPVPYLFRNYEYPPTHATGQALYMHEGTSAVPLWQALRATTAAPSYFPELTLLGTPSTAVAAPVAAAAADAAADATVTAAADAYNAKASAPCSTKPQVTNALAAGGTGCSVAEVALASDLGAARLMNVRSLVFQDGALLANNPAALALHEVRLLRAHAISPMRCILFADTCSTDHGRLAFEGSYPCLSTCPGSAALPRCADCVRCLIRHWRLCTD